MGCRLSSPIHNRASNRVSMGTNWSIFKWTNPAGECVIKTARSRRRDFIELVGIYGLILLVIWTPRPWQWPMWGRAPISIIAVIAVSFEGMRPMGLCTVNLARSLWAVALAMTVALFAVWVAGRMHTLQLASSPWWALRHYGGYAIWAGLQQLILQSFFLSRTLRLMRTQRQRRQFRLGCSQSRIFPSPPHFDHPVLRAGVVPLLSAIQESVAAGGGARDSGDFDCDHDSGVDRSQHACGHQLSDVGRPRGDGACADLHP